MSGVDWGEKNDPESFARLMAQFTEKEYRLISATVQRVAECIEGMENIDDAIQYCMTMSRLTLEMAEKKRAARDETVQKERAG